MSIKKYSSGSWVTVPYRKYETATDTITSLPQTIIGDGQNISAYTIKGNMTQSGTPTPSNPIYPQECGDLVTTGEHAGEYEIPILSNGTTYPIYLSEPIRKIGDYTDTINSDGTITRNIGHIKLNTLTWSDYATNQFASTQSIDKIFGAGVDTMLCDTYICAVNRSTLVNNAIAPWNSTTSNRLVVQDNQYSTAADWIAAMGGVGIWYILATPTTESVTAPSIPTSGTAQTFDVDTTLKPSEVSLTYHGWHEHEDTKYTTP